MKKILLLMLLVSISTFGQIKQKNDQQYANAVKDLLQLQGSDEAYRISLKTMMDMLKKQSPQKAGELDAIEEVFLAESLQDLNELLIPVYAKHLTLSDLEKIIDFYKTPVGKKLTKKMPLITKEMVLIGGKWGQDVVKKIRKKLEK